MRLLKVYWTLGLSFALILCLGVVLFHKTYVSFQDFNAISYDQEFVPWSQRDLFNLSVEEQSRFFKDKEREYAQRRERIWSICQNSTTRKMVEGHQIDSNKILKQSMVHDMRHKVSYCMIPKVASSTWSMHFIKFANVSQKTISIWSDALQSLVLNLWPFPMQLDPLEAMEGQTSIVISRHPLDRIASVYSQKLVNLGQSSWKDFSTWLIRKYRTSEPNRLPNLVLVDLPDKDLYVSPQEFVAFLIDNLNGRGIAQDRHWIPQSSLCPFCLFNFTVYAKMETLWEDTAYFMLKSGLTHIMDPELRKNPSHPTGHLKYQRLFWSSVDPQAITEIIKLYELDFNMFDYYFDKPDPSTSKSQILLTNRI